MAIELTKIAFSPEELDVKMLRRMPEERFAAVIGIPAIVLGFGSGGDSSTYNNTEQADERAIENYVVPLSRYIAGELTHQLGPDFDFRKNQKFRFDLSQVRALADDQDKLYERLDRAYNGGWLKRSEVRAAAGYDFKPEDEVYSTDLRTQSAIAIAAARPQLQPTRGQGTQGRDEDQQGQKRLPPDTA
jgi:phage portal protein BeeE